MPHGSHIYAKAYDMSRTTICAYPQSDHELPHWKCVMQCCAKYPSINIPDQETDDQYSNSRKSINSSLLSWRDHYLKKIKYQSQNYQNRRSGEKSNSHI